MREYPSPADKSATGIPLANEVRISSDGSPIAPDDPQEYICVAPSGGMSVPFPAVGEVVPVEINGEDVPFEIDGEDVPIEIDGDLVPVPSEEVII